MRGILNSRPGIGEARHRPLSQPTLVTAHATRVLIIRLGVLGDVVRTLPALRAIRAAYPDAHISWLVEKGASGVLEGRRELDCVIQFPRENLTDSLRTLALGKFWRQLAAFVQTLRAESFDLVIDFHAILKSGVIARLTGAHTRVSYSASFSRAWSFLFATHRGTPGLRNAGTRRSDRLDRSRTSVCRKR